MSSASEDKEDEGTIRAVERAIAVLNAFSIEQPSMSVIEIQKKVGLSRPTLYRLLATLSAARLVRGEGDPQRFSLDHGVMKFANVWLSTLDTVDLARPLLEALRDSSGETTGIFLLNDVTRICALECKSREAISYSRGLGNAGNITEGATGKAILAALPDDRIETVLDKLARSPDHRAQLLEAVRQTRERGYAISYSEIIDGAVAMASAFRNQKGDVVGSVGLFGPLSRFDDGKVEAASRSLMGVSEQLSSKLGFSPQRAARSR
ncbi:IclR family transcriptional regulator [Xanthobacter oligotrophicus]|uniref:IclR family transcriptional regulator n=1 Tax=Xanthobacter oligotrophicus TaxID=2607286 RepID=A0ABW7A2X2_9HYPH